MGFKSVLDFICGINNSTKFIFSLLPLLYSIITIIFIILGIVGVIAFGLGNKFKNLARNVYGVIHLITTFISMLVIFNVTYCSMVIQSNTEGADNVASKFTMPGFIKESNGPNLAGGGIGSKIKKMITKIFDFINNLLENNSLPFIIVQVLCTSIIVIIITFMSSIFKGISKAGYDMHCTDSNQVFDIPGWGKIVDFFMHLFLIISSIAVIIYFILRLVKDGFGAMTSGFGLKSCDTKPMTIQDAITSATKSIDDPDAQQAIIELTYALQEWPIMRAIFVMTLSYYIIHLFLRWFEDVISNNIVLLSSWQKRETECSDEPNKESKTNMERGFVLFCNILLFILLVVITLALVVAHLYFNPIIRKGIGEVIKYYTPAAATLSVPLEYNSLKETASKLARGKINIQKMENKVFNQLSKAVNSKGEIDLQKINLDIAFEGMGDSHSGITIDTSKKSPITKSQEEHRPPDIPIFKNEEDEERYKEYKRQEDAKIKRRAKTSTNPKSLNEVPPSDTAIVQDPNVSGPLQSVA
jgi:flagellar biogenesis protein FliO